MGFVSLIEISLLNILNFPKINKFFEVFDYALCVTLCVIWYIILFLKRMIEFIIKVCVCNLMTIFLIYFSIIVYSVFGGISLPFQDSLVYKAVMFLGEPLPLSRLSILGFT